MTQDKPHIIFVFLGGMSIQHLYVNPPGHPPVHIFSQNGQLITTSKIVERHLLCVNFLGISQVDYISVNVTFPTFLSSSKYRSFCLIYKVYLCFPIYDEITLSFT